MVTYTWLFRLKKGYKKVRFKKLHLIEQGLCKRKAKKAKTNYS